MLSWPMGMAASPPACGLAWAAWDGKLPGHRPAKLRILEKYELFFHALFCEGSRLRRLGVLRAASCSASAGRRNNHGTKNKPCPQSTLKRSQPLAQAFGVAAAACLPPGFSSYKFNSITVLTSRDYWMLSKPVCGCCQFQILESKIYYTPQHCHGANSKRHSSVISYRPVLLFHKLHDSPQTLSVSSKRVR